MHYTAGGTSSYLNTAKLQRKESGVEAGHTKEKNKHTLEELKNETDEGVTR